MCSRISANPFPRKPWNRTGVWSTENPRWCVDEHSAKNRVSGGKRTESAGFHAGCLSKNENRSCLIRRADENFPDRNEKFILPGP